MTLVASDIHEIGPRRHAFANGTRTYTTTYYAETNANNADPWELRPLIVAAVPSFWATDTTAILASVDLQQLREKRSAWTADLSYSINGESDENPLNKRRELSFTWVNYTKTIMRDIYGTLITNTAGDVTPIEEDDARPEVRLVWNVASFSPAIANQYRNAVNADPWFGLDPGFAKVAGLTATEKLTSSGTVYFTVEATIQINGDNWKRKLISRGLYVQFESDANQDGVSVTLRQPIVDNATHQPITEPALLNEDGTAPLADGDPPVIREWETLPKQTFSSFFPTS